MTDGSRIPAVKVNPIDPERLSRNDQLAMLAGMVQLYRDQSEPLSVAELNALGAALDQVTWSGETPTVTTVAAALIDPTEITVASLQLPEDRVIEIGFAMAAELKQLTDPSAARYDQTIWALPDAAFDARFPFLMGRRLVRSGRPSMRTRIVILVIALLVLAVATGIVHI